jgi:hypothetical protein
LAVVKQVSVIAEETAGQERLVPYCHAINAKAELTFQEFEESLAKCAYQSHSAREAAREGREKAGEAQDDLELFEIVENWLNSTYLAACKKLWKGRF